MKKLLALLLIAAFSATAEPVIVQASVMVQVGPGTGSGVVLENKRVLTCAHLFFMTEGAGEKPHPIFITRQIWREDKLLGTVTIPCKLVKRDDSQDLALLEPAMPEELPVTVGLGDTPAQGDPLYHVGSFTGARGIQSFSSGVMASVGRRMEHPVLGEMEVDQISCPAYPGSSGGGVFNQQGKLVGIVTGQAAENLGFMVPARRINKFLK